MIKYLKNVQPGDLVAVNSHHEGTVYKVDKIEAGQAYLTYRAGSDWVSGGTFPATALRSPTPDQLAMHNLEG